MTRLHRFRPWLWVGCLSLLSLAWTAHCAAQNTPNTPPQSPSQPLAAGSTPAEHVRGAEQTLLTFPEWFLVFSPNEFAQWTATHAPSQFPWWGHIGQLWGSYASVTRESQRRDMAPNPGYHLMIMVIGVSTTVEYAIRSAYESLVGRLTESTASHQTAEDHLAAQVAQEYVDFIQVRPWYEFDFATPLQRLWSQTGWWGDAPLRKWERKFALSTEYSVKMLYARLITLGTHSVYDAPLPTTAVIVRGTLPAADPQWPDVQVLQRWDDGQTLLTIPRYEAFTHYAQYLAQHGVQLERIAGNNGSILVSLLVPPTWQAPADVQTLFSQSIITGDQGQRVALMVPVASLSQHLRQWQAAGVPVEHIFDY